MPPYTSYHRRGIAITENELRKIISRHEKWVYSSCRLGERADFSGFELLGVDFSNFKLNSALFCNADLTGTNFTRADLSGADFRGANLAQVNLTESDLTSAIVKNANLKGVDFTRAVMSYTIVADVDLSMASGLENVVHNGPSTIGLDTLYASRGNIPEIFLRGVGISDSLIQFINNDSRMSFQHYSCFISYSSSDQDFADQLYSDLQDSNIRCWFAPHDIKSGQEIYEQIDYAIKSHDKLLLLLSQNSIHSEWVNTEIANAFERQDKEQTKVFFPIRLVDFEALKMWKCVDPDSGVDFAREIRKYYIPDFSDWENPTSYKQVFERLKNDLKKTQTAVHAGF